MELQELRDKVSAELLEYRAKHILSTEAEAVRIAQVYLPNKIEKVRISALLHDITKEYSYEKQLQILDDFDIIVDNVTLHSPKVLHALTAALLIPEKFPEFADDEIILAVRNHTTGAVDMSLLDIVIYLADYIEPERQFEDCKKLREYFWGGLNSCRTHEEKMLHLYKTMVTSFDLTIANLVAQEAVIAEETFAARNEFVLKCLNVIEGKSNE